MDEDLKNLLRDLISKLNQTPPTTTGPPPGQPPGTGPVGGYAGGAGANIPTPQDAATIQQIGEMEARRKNYSDGIARSLEQQRSIAKNIESIIQRTLKIKREEEAAARNLYNEQQKVVRVLEEDLSLSKQNSSVTQSEIQAKQQILSQHKGELQDLKTKLELSERSAQLAQQEASLIAQVEARTQSLVSTLSQGILTANAASKTGMFGALFGSGSGAGFFEKLKTSGKAIGQIASPLNASLSVVGYLTDAFKKLFWATDETAAKFRRATGAGQEYTKVLTQTIQRNTRFGIITEEAGRAMTALHTQMRSFSGATDSAQRSVIDLTLRMTRLGVSEQTTARMTDMLTKAMGMNINQAIAAQDKIAVYARQIKVSEQEAAQAFLQFSGALAAHGPNMINVFKGLISQVKQTGVEMSSLVNIANQFDTFESAAASVGKLNALLGGSHLNSLRMVNATESERIRLVAEAVRASGANINALGRFTQKALAQAIGAKDSAEAMKILRGQLNMLTPAELQAAEAMEANKRKAEENMSIQMKLKTILLSLANSLMPLIEKLHENRDAIVDVITRVAAFMQKNGALIAQFAILFPVIRTGVSLVGGLSTAFRAMGVSAGAARLGILGLGAGVLYFATQLLKPMFSPSAIRATPEFADDIKKLGDKALLAQSPMRDLGVETGKLARNLSIGAQATAQLGSAYEVVGKHSSKAASGVRAVSSAGRNASKDMQKAANSTAQLAFGVQSIQKNVDKLNTAKLADFGQKINLVTENLNLTDAQNENIQKTVTNINRVAMVGQQATEHASAAGVERLAVAVNKFNLTQVTQTTQTAAAASAGGQRNVIIETPRDVIVDLDGITVGRAALQFIDKERSSRTLVGRS